MARSRSVAPLHPALSSPRPSHFPASHSFDPYAAKYYYLCTHIVTAIKVISIIDLTWYLLGFLALIVCGSANYVTLGGLVGFILDSILAIGSAFGLYTAVKQYKRGLVVPYLVAKVIQATLALLWLAIAISGLILGAKIMRPVFREGLVLHKIEQTINQNFSNYEYFDDYSDEQLISHFAGPASVNATNSTSETPLSFNVSTQHGNSSDSSTMTSIVQNDLRWKFMYNGTIWFVVHICVICITTIAAIVNCIFFHIALRCFYYLSDYQMSTICNLSTMTMSDQHHHERKPSASVSELNPAEFNSSALHHKSSYPNEHYHGHESDTDDHSNLHSDLGGEPSTRGTSARGLVTPQFTHPIPALGYLDPTKLAPQLLLSARSNSSYDRRLSLRDPIENPLKDDFDERGA